MQIEDKVTKSIVVFKRLTVVGCVNPNIATHWEWEDLASLVKENKTLAQSQSQLILRKNHL